MPDEPPGELLPYSFPADLRRYQAQFLRAIEEHSPEVLEDLRDRVLPLFPDGTFIGEFMDWGERRYHLFSGRAQPVGGWLLQVGLETLWAWRETPPSSGRPLRFCFPVSATQSQREVQSACFAEDARIQA